MKKLPLLIFLSLVSLAPCYAQTTQDSLEAELREIIAASEIPGLGVVLTSGTEVLYSGGFGYADVEQRRPYGRTTIQPVASVSKIVIAIALMKLVEEEKLKLDVEINTILPFRVVNPWFPGVPITLFQLATHTSSINDTNASDFGTYYYRDRTADKRQFPKGFDRYYQKGLRNDSLGNGEYLRAYLSDEGKAYGKKIFGKYQPGTAYAYSNVGAALAAYVVELVSGQSFEEYTQQEIFKPLGMEDAGWRKEAVPESMMAQPYFENGNRVPDYAILPFPAAMLHVNSVDMGKLMVEVLRGYNGNGKLLKASSYRYMLTNHLDLKSMAEPRGILWRVSEDGTNFGHSGAELGTATNLVFNPGRERGLFVMVNISSFEDERMSRDFIAVLNTIGKYAFGQWN